MEIEIMGYRVYADTIQKLIPSGSKRIINTLNAYSFVTAEKDSIFKESLMRSDILLADGFPVVLAARLLKGEKIQKIAGEDLFFQMVKKLNETGGSCFFLGASESTLSKIRLRMMSDYPAITVSTLSPPFKADFSEEDINEMLGAINIVRPDVLFVGLTAPKQEKLVSKIYDRLECGDICSIGAVFDFYAGTNKRPAKIWINLRLEWLARLLKEPTRLWKRYLIYSPLFFVYLLKHLMGAKRN